MAVSAVTSTGATGATNPGLGASAQNTAAKVVVSETTQTGADGSVTLTITYSDGTTSTVTEPGDTVTLSAAATALSGGSAGASAPSGK